MHAIKGLLSLIKKKKNRMPTITYLTDYDRLLLNKGSKNIFLVLWSLFSPLYLQVKSIE